MSIERIDLNNPDWGFTFSSCVIAGDFVFTAHHAGYDFEKGEWPEGIEAQTEQCFTNLERTLHAAGVTLNDVVRTTVFLTDTTDFRGMREVYRRQFTEGYPARSGLFTVFLDPECLVQIEAVAYKPPQTEGSV
jgi:2-iminobutanoate/2-iminopropanoate deaminase